MDDLDPHLVTSRIRKPVREIKGLKCPIQLKEGKMEVDDMKELQLVKDFLYGAVDITKLKNETYSNQISGIPGYPDFNPSETILKMNNFGKYSNELKQIKKW